MADRTLDAVPIRLHGIDVWVGLTVLVASGLFSFGLLPLAELVLSGLFAFAVAFFSMTLVVESDVVALLGAVALLVGYQLLVILGVMGVVWHVLL